LQAGRSMVGYIAYCPVSTGRQGQSGFGLEAQRQAVRRHLNSGARNLIGEYAEVESGKRPDRPELRVPLGLARRERELAFPAAIEIADSAAAIAALLISETRQL
jgi:hypothetical protein